MRGGHRRAERPVPKRGTEMAALLRRDHPRVALVGLRGAGKSSIGARLAKGLGVPFVELDLEGNPAARQHTGPFQRARVYSGGNLKDFEARAKASGDRVLFVGDHIYGDMLRSRKTRAEETLEGQAGDAPAVLIRPPGPRGRPGRLVGPRRVGRRGPTVPRARRALRLPAGRLR